MSSRDSSTCDSKRREVVTAPLSDRCNTNSRRIAPPTLLLSLSVLLSACGAGTSENTTFDGRESSGSSSGVVAAGLTGTISESNISSSASQLANDATITLSDALALASGGTPPGENNSLDAEAIIDTGDEPIIRVDPLVGVNPTAVTDIPTAAAATPVVASTGTDASASPTEEATSSESSTTPSSVDSVEVVETDADNASSGAVPVVTQTANPFEPVASVDNGNADAEDESSNTSTADTGAIESTPDEQEPAFTGASESEPESSKPEPEPEPVSSVPPSEEASSQTDAESNTSESASSESIERRFTSTNTAGFVGEVLDDGTVKVSWSKAPNARGYNVYRQSEFYASVSTNEMIDDDIFDGDYYYEIQSYDFDNKLEYIAFGLTVRVAGTGRTDPNAPAKNADLLSGYDLVFADEFDTGALDTTKWNTAFLWGPDLIINSEEQYYVDTANDPNFGFDPFSFDDGKLVISAVETPVALRSKANDQPYLSGIITSYDSFKFTYGYVETRARMPYGKGLWPAFWLLNAYYVDAEPEIDIMEFIGDNQDTVYHTYHYYDSAGTLRSTHSEPTKGTDWTIDFHTYGVDWRPGLLVFYVDGVEVHRVSDPSVSSQDMYLLANTALGGWWAGSPDATTPFPARYELDYIRVYRQTQPYGDPPLSDGTSNVRVATEVDASPAHRPPFELWPEGYPGGR